MRALIVIPAANLAEARAIAVEHLGQTEEQAALSFVPAGSPTGEAPATHYWLSAQVSPENTAKLPSLAASLLWARVEEYDLVTQPGRPVEVLAEMGLTRLGGVLNQVLPDEGTDEGGDHGSD